MVQPLHGFDGAFLTASAPHAPLHVGAVLILEPPIPSHHQLQELVAERLPVVPALRRRLVQVPLGLGHPLWVDDARFDLGRHLRRAALPSPGGPLELWSLVADVMGRPLDHRHPLWEMVFIEGLESGHLAIVVKIHHAAIDGVSGAEALAAFLDPSPGGRPAPAAAPWEGEPVPAAGDLLRHGLRSALRQPELALDIVVRSLAAVRQVSERRRRWREEDELEPPPVPFAAPRCVLNGPISSHRRFASAEVPMQDLQLIRARFGGTVNDVVLAAVGGALRSLLLERQALPEPSLVALVPRSTRPPTGGGEPSRTADAASGAPTHPAAAAPRRSDPSPANQVSAMVVELATHLPDPVARLAAVAAGAQRAKEQSAALPDDLVHRWAQLLVPALTAPATALSAGLRLLERLPPLCNVVVSNLPGSPVPLWCCGARLVGLYPLGPVADGIGLNVTVISYDDSLFAGLLACRDLVPDVDHLARLFAESVVELRKAAERAVPPIPGARRLH